MVELEKEEEEGRGGEKKAQFYRTPSVIIELSSIQSPYVEGITSCPFLTYPRFTLF